MEDFPSNSHTKASKPAQPEKQIEKVISGEAIARKPSGLKRLRQSFIAGDSKTVGEYVLWSVMIPAAKDALTDMGMTFVDMMINGNRRTQRFSGAPPSGPGSTSKINYGGYSTGGSRLIVGQNQNNPTQEQSATRYSPNEIIVPTRAEAEMIVYRMQEIIDQYTVVTVADLYRMVGVTAEYTDDKWGWDNLQDADVKRAGRDGVLLMFPRPKPVD